MKYIIHLQNFYHLEIQRGRAGLSNKTKYREAKLEKDEIKVPIKIIDPSEIIQYERSVISEVVRPKKDQPEKEKTSTQTIENKENESMDLESPLKNLSHNDSSASSTPSNAATFTAFDETKTHEIQKMSVQLGYESVIVQVDSMPTTFTQSSIR